MKTISYYNFFVSLLVLLLGACANPKISKKGYFRNVPTWLVEDRSSYILQAIGTWNVTPNVTETQAIDRSSLRAKERVAYQITEKIHTVYVKSKDDQHKKHDFTVVRQIEGAILKGLKDNMEMLNKWVNPYNNEVFVMVKAKSYNADILRKSLQRIPSLNKKTIDNILKAIAEIFNDSFSYDEANIPREM
ncbi:hypothetical protein [Helicobacter cetorum]|uniref:hypothetical protein n=1 Tax=Helicobacter cetorum TaxID=138563 RepID=UPI000CF01FED|nr:hypothetical protein [Helicobacter cetorum]